MRFSNSTLISNLLAAACACFLALQIGCLPTAENEVVVYTALDKEFSEVILKEFAAESGVQPLPKFDTESNKSVGLATEIINSKNRQRADVFWNNEILHSLRLKKMGLLSVYQSELADQYPADFVSKDHDWYGFAARARVFIVNTDLLPKESDRPTSVDDLLNPKWKDKCAIARPLFGTTATHAAVLFASMGEEKAKVYLQNLADNAQVESGNKQVAKKVAAGQYAFGLTDTDDAIIELERGAPVVIVFPDQIKIDGIARGTLFIPNTICLIKDGPNPENAKRLVDYLLQASVEEKLAVGASAQIPLNKTASVKSRVEPEDGIKVMKVDFHAAADAWSEAQPWLEKTFPLGQK